ncbi:hypothetical protein SEVIR_2G391501v4 [Setaria viridis]|nr:predicted GPI-anchored protein 58 [Setaria viridis]
MRSRSTCGASLISPRGRLPPSPGPSLPSSDGDSGHDGNPAHGYGESHGDGGPRLHGFHCSRGVPDGVDGRQSGGGNVTRRSWAPQPKAAPAVLLLTQAPPPTSSPAQDDAALRDGTAAAMSPAEAHTVSLLAQAPPPPSSPAQDDAAATTSPPEGDTTESMILTSKSESAAPTPQPESEGPTPPLPTSLSGAGGHFPEAEADNKGEAPVLSFPELVAFEEQCPVRDCHGGASGDPMLFV